MHTDLAALTEKEKQALRLLVTGYDAKSMARHLGLSVHTINERLRDARRKLSVSSSREAARMLHAVESADPELLGDKHFGDAGGADRLQIAAQPVRGAGNWRRTGWIVGGLVMTIALSLLALSALSGAGDVSSSSTGSTPQVAATPASERAAIDAARAFLTVIDRDDWTASWQMTHKSFQLLNTVEWWTEASRKVRAEVGTVQSRELATVNFTAAPPEGYWEVSFKARYSKKGAVTETLSLAYEDGAWKVAGIMVE